MEVETKVACGSLVAGGGGVAGAYGVHRLSVAHESEPEAPTPAAQAEGKDTNADDQTGRSDAENDEEETPKVGEQASEGAQKANATPEGGGSGPNPKVTPGAEDTNDSPGEVATHTSPETQSQGVTGDSGSQSQTQRDSEASSSSSNTLAQNTEAANGYSGTEPEKAVET